MVEDKASQVIGLIVKIILFLGIGTLPYIDNFARKWRMEVAIGSNVIDGFFVSSDVGGFFTGIVLALCFLPFISFTHADGIRKLLTKIVALLALIALFLGLLYKFYTDGSIACQYCDYIDW